MIANWAGVVWKKMPRTLRSRIVRLTQAKFTVSTAVVIINDKSEVLLLNHFIRPRSGWGIPGGFLGFGEQPDEGIRREIREETGIELKALRLIRTRTLGKHLEILFTAEPDGVPEVNSIEIKELAWFAADEMPGKMNSAQKHLIEEVLSGKVEK